MYFPFIIVTTTGAIATLAAAALTAVLIVKGLSILRRSHERIQYADKNSVPSSRIEQKAHKNLDEMEQGLREEPAEKGQRVHEEPAPKDPRTQGPDGKEPSSPWDVHGQELGRQSS